MRHRIAPTTPSPDTDAALRRELYFFTLFRALEAALLALMLFSGIDTLLVPPRYLALGQATAIVYLALSVVLLISGRKGQLRTQALIGIAVDIGAAILATHALPSASAGIAMMLLFNIGAASLLLPLRLGLVAGMVAALALFGEFLWSLLADGGSQRPMAELLMFAVSFQAMAMLTHLLGRQMRASEHLAVRRGREAANMAQVNELILRRLRTGVMLVDGNDNLRLTNEAATLQLGDIDQNHNLALVAPELARRLQQWRVGSVDDDTPIRFAADLPEVVPRFTRLMVDSEQVLIFLDDISLVSRRAESMTLATLGRFSASLAHEIRNPLAAINYAVQLLQESQQIPDSDRRLLEIVHQQAQRMNGIVENVLGLARRERARPEHVELVEFTQRFIDDYIAGHPLESDTLQLQARAPELATQIDPQQLHQVLTALVYNALLYGRMPEQPARVTIHVHVSQQSTPTIDVIDRGPGIPQSVASQLFQPFFTTSGIGTGLGLYIARELCRANQASLEYIAMPGGGSCFRICLPDSNTLLA